MRFLASLIFFALLPSYAQVYSPMTGSERAKYYVQDTFRLRSFLLSGPAVAGMRTWQDRPEEWDRTWGGFGKRYAARVAVNTISNSTEIGKKTLAISRRRPASSPAGSAKPPGRLC